MKTTPHLRRRQDRQIQIPVKELSAKLRDRAIHHLDIHARVKLGKPRYHIRHKRQVKCAGSADPQGSPLQAAQRTKPLAEILFQKVSLVQVFQQCLPFLGQAQRMRLPVKDRNVQLLLHLLDLEGNRRL